MLNFYQVGERLVMIGREDKESNDLFYTCSLIGYIRRKTKNHPAAVVQALGAERIAKIYDLADIYHCDNIDRVSDDLIEEAHISNGTFDNIARCEYAVPTHWDIGKVYKRLILSVAKSEGIDIISALMDIYGSKMTDLIEDYNSSFYYDSPSIIFETYRNNCIPVE